MLRWCQNVNVYNIENHYHFYTDQEPKSRSLSSILSGKLKAGAISVSSTQNSKMNSKSCFKKGLKLSKMMRNPEDKGKQDASSQFIKKYSSMALNLHARSATGLFKDIAQTKSIQSEQSLKKDNEKREEIVIQQELHPGIKMSTPAIDFKQQNQQLLTNLYSNQSRRKKKYTEIKNDNPNFLGVIPKKILHHVKHISDSRNISPNQQTKSQFQISESLNDYQNSRYNTSRSVSGVVGQQQHNSDRVYFRILEMSRGEAREASIILSNILSRSTHNSHCETRRKSGKNNERRLNFEDKLTILSQNDAQSQGSLKIEESELYDSDPKNNFTLLDKQMKTAAYTVNLAIENCLKCVISLKQICFREMSTISQELQMYQFLEQNFSKSDTYRNILELYQVQMASGSYLLIKEPFTHYTHQYVKSLSEEQSTKFTKDLQEIIRILLIQFAHHLIYPTRLFSYNDFVICESVIKFHDMSIFKQMKAPMIQMETLVLEINDASSLEIIKEGHN